MTLSQSKVDLAVLYKLHQHAEVGGGAITPADVMRLFNAPMSLRRIELALEELQAKQDIERDYHPFYSEEGLWQISRDGMARVDRALRVPASFIARLHCNGDFWLESDEAKQAILKKLTPAPATEAVTPNIKLPPSSVSSGDPVKVDWTKWGTIFAGIGIVVTILLWWFS